MPEPVGGANDDQELLTRLRSVSDSKVDSASRAVAKFSEEDDEHDKRWRKAETRRTFYQIRRWFFWFLFVLVCATVTITVAGYVYLVYLWVANLIWGTAVRDVAGLQSVITNVFVGVLLIFATLFFEGVFKDHEN